MQLRVVLSDWWGRRWLRRLAIAVVVTPVVVALLGFLVLPPIVRHVAEKQLSSLLGRRVAVARVRLNPFALSVTVEGLSIFEADGVTPFFGFGRLYVNVEAASIYRRGPVVRELTLEGPRLRVVRLSATSTGPGPLPGYNFSDIVARLATPTEPPKAPEPASTERPRFSLNNLRLVDGEVTFDDRPLGTTHRIAELNVGVPFVSTLPLFVDTFVQPGLRVRIDGAPFVVGGRTKPFKDSLETSVELRVADLDLTRFVPYVPVALKFDVTSARLTLALDAAFVRPNSGSPAVSVKGRVALEKVELRHPGGEPLLRLRKLETVIGNAEITAQRFRVDRIALSGLQAHARRLGNGSFDLERLVPPSDPSPPAPAPAPAGEPPRFEIGEVRVDDVLLRLRDESVRPAVTFSIDEVSVAVDGLSNRPGATGKVKLSLHAAPGGTLTHEGTLALAPLAADGTIRIEGIELARFAPYYRDQILFDIPSGRLRVGTSYHFAAGPSAKAPPVVRLGDARLELSDLVLHRRGASARDDFFKLGSLIVQGGAVDLGKHTVTVAQISTRDGKLRAARDAAGVVDLTTLVPPEKPTAAKTPTRAPEPPGPAWTVALAHFDLDKWGVHFDDRAVSPAAAFDVTPIAIKLGDVSTAPGARASLDVRLGLNKRGRIAITGSAALAPVAADLRLDLRTIELLPLQPYFADQVTLTVTDGTVSLKGQAKVSVPAAPKNGPAPDPRVDFAGDIDVANFASLDGRDREPLLGWKLLHVGGLALSTSPQKLAIREVALTDFLSRLVMGADGNLNLASIVAEPKAAPPAKKPEPTPPKTPEPAKTAAAQPSPVTIGQVTLAGGRVTFADRSIRPGYAAELSGLSGKIAGLSSDASTQADIDLRGSVDQSGALTIAGKVNPLAKDLFVDLKVDLKELELPPASPYTGKYAGYNIGKGKLGLSLDYHIEKSRLEARNRLVLDQFTFGDKVASADATKLPVRLAVALLKDRHGVIDIDLPVSGSLEDPQFKVGRAILKVLGNLIVKAVTAPFSLIASAFGGGDELSHLDFAPGLSALENKEQTKVRTLAKVLHERPGLSFEIEGNADPDRDRNGLVRVLYERKLRAQRALELAKEGTAVSSPDELRLEATDRPRLIEKAYKAETFAKPRNFLGADKALPPAEMEKLILANTTVGEDDLRALAQQRAKAVLAALSRAEPDAATRLYLVSPKVAGAKAPASRVELRLRSE